MPDPTNRTELTTMPNTRNMTRGTIAAIKSAVETHYGCEPGDGLSRPAIYTGDHEEVDADFVLSWEEGPDGWVFDEVMTDIINDVVKTASDFCGASMHTEVVHGWGCIALYVD